MSTTPVMLSDKENIYNSYATATEPDAYCKEVAYMLSGKTDSDVHTYATMGIILLHDSTEKNASLESAVRKYTALYSDSIMCACSDGSMISERIQDMFPGVCFFSMGEDEDPNTGTVLNVLFSEIRTDLVFVSWTNVDPYGISTRALLNTIEEVPLCIAPVFENAEGNVIPLAYKPRMCKGGFGAVSDSDVVFLPYTFIPHNFVGIFNRKKMLTMGGFDGNISDSFWQLCDFGMRAYAMGNHVRLSPYYRVRRRSEHGVSSVKHTTKENPVKYKHNDMYHLMCFKHGVGSRLLHALGCIASALLARRGMTAHGVKSTRECVRLLREAAPHKNTARAVAKIIPRYW